MLKDRHNEIKNLETEIKILHQKLAHQQPTQLNPSDGDQLIFED